MRLIKMLGLAAVAAMTLVGATSASAANTQLCNSHTELVCGFGQGATSISVLGSGRILGDPVDIICDHIAGSGTPLALANPQQVHFTSLLFHGCDTDTDDGCVVTATLLPLANLNKTGLDAGVLTFENGSILALCEDVIFTIDIHCTYDATGLQFTVGAQHLTANGTPLSDPPEDLCPDESALHALLVTTGGNRYVLA